jgi:hypothetical protein
MIFCIQTVILSRIGPILLDLSFGVRDQGAWQTDRYLYSTTAELQDQLASTIIVRLYWNLSGSPTSHPHLSKAQDTKSTEEYLR